MNSYDCQCVVFRNPKQHVLINSKFIQVCIMLLAYFIQMNFQGRDKMHSFYNNLIFSDLDGNIADKKDA